MDIDTLLQDIAACEDDALCLRDKLSGSTDFGLNFDNIDYRDAATVRNYLSQGKALLCPLKELRKALQSLTRHAEYAIYKIENKIQPLALHDGINSMPEEVLATIFDLAISSGYAYGECYVRTLASVNQKFRNAALGSRKLWSTLIPEEGEKLFKLSLRRSGNAPITIDVDSETPEWFMDEVLALGNRWERLVVHQDMHEFMSHMREYGKREGAHQTYPRLQALEIYSSNSGLRRDDSESPWNVPAIKSLICTNVISALSDESFASLTTLEMTMDGYVLETILPQLYLMRNLQFLSLMLGEVRKCWKSDSYPDCNLESLREMHLTCLNSSVEDLDVFLNKINMENVKKFQLDFFETFRDIISSKIKSVFNPYGELKSRLRFSSLEDITIIGDLRKNLDILAPEAGVFLLYPKIRNLHIQVPFLGHLHCHLMKDNQLDIRTVSILGCLSGARDFLERLLSHINPDGSKLCRGLTKLRVWRCAEVTMNFLMDYLPEEKIDFLPYEAPYFFDGP